MKTPGAMRWVVYFPPPAICLSWDSLTPVPAFAPHPYSRELLGISDDDLLEYRGYIDTNLDINRSGNVRGIKVTGESEGTPFKVRSRLLDYLKSQRMRPALVEGEPAALNNLDIRFYYTY